MPLRDELCFVQFIHPGGEHRPHASAAMDWNQGPHKRKFIEIAGRCHRQETLFDGLLRFWAEWEPQSITTVITQPLENGPRFVHKPFYVVPESYGCLQNTDPLVFGGFFYAGCQQNTSFGHTQLHFLKRGSVILFGSCINGRFVLDTVFVVDRWEDYDAQKFHQLKRLVPQSLWDVTIQPLYPKINGGGCNEEAMPENRLYRGATFDKPVDGMFSFFPCLPADQGAQGFARPVIAIAETITSDLRQGKKLNRGSTPSVVRDSWNSVRQQVESAGLWLGVSADSPDQRKAKRALG